jgi:hypothetical protein
MVMKILVSKDKVLTDFAKRIPNADKMLVDYGRDSLLVQFGVYSNEYKISEILDKFISGAKASGVEVIFEKMVTI